MPRPVQAGALVRGDVIVTSAGTGRVTHVQTKGRTVSVWVDWPDIGEHKAPDMDMDTVVNLAPSS